MTSPPRWVVVIGGVGVALTLALVLKDEALARMPWLGTPQVQGFIIATVIGFAAIVVDFWQLTEKLPNQYQFCPVWRIGSGWLFCLIFSSFAGGAFLWAANDPTSAVAKTLSFNQEGLYQQAIACGVSITLLIRSKIFQVGKTAAPVGIDWIYDRTQVRVVREMANCMLKRKEALFAKHQVRLLRKDLDTRLSHAVGIILQSEPDLLGKFAEQYGATVQRKPQTDFSSGSDEWIQYCNGIARLAADFIGIERVIDHA